MLDANRERNNAETLSQTSEFRRLSEEASMEVAANDNEWERAKLMGGAAVTVIL